MSQSAAEALYTQTFGEAPKWVACGPGRINLIGEHTDYSGGFVFPVAIDKEIWVAAGPSPDGLTHLVSAEKGEGIPFAHGDLNPSDRLEGWTKYPAGVAWSLAARTPIRAAVASTLPDESGVSSSAAIEMAFSVIWNFLDEMGKTNVELALDSQKAENQYVGMPCGIMDQLASAMGREGQAMFIDTRSLAIEYAPVPSDLLVVLCDTGFKRQLTGGEYKERREQVEAAARKVGVEVLRDATLEMLEDADLTELEYKRARHVITENERCPRFAEALRTGDHAAIRSLMHEAHLSMKDDFGATVPAIDAMQQACSESKGCVGARITGGGFGGACVALVEAQYVEDFLSEAESKYRILAPGLEPKLIVCAAAEGARLIRQ